MSDKKERRKLPRSEPPAFEEFPLWSATNGGVLYSVHILGFVDGFPSHSSSDPSVEEWREFVYAWWERFGDAEVRAKQLLDLCINESLLLEVLGEGSRNALMAALEDELLGKRDAIFGEFQILRSYRKDRHGAFYKLRRLSN